MKKTNVLANNPLTKTSVENERLQTQIRKLQSELVVQNDLKESLDMAVVQLDQSERARRAMHEKLEEIAEANSKLTKEILESETRVLTEKKKNRLQIVELEKAFSTQVYERDQKIMALEEKRMSLEARVSDQEAKLLTLADVNE